MVSVIYATLPWTKKHHKYSQLYSRCGGDALNVTHSKHLFSVTHPNCASNRNAITVCSSFNTPLFMRGDTLIDMQHTLILMPSHPTYRFTLAKIDTAQSTEIVEVQSTPILKGFFSDILTTVHTPQKSSM